MQQGVAALLALAVVCLLINRSPLEGAGSHTEGSAEGLQVKVKKLQTQVYRLEAALESVSHQGVANPAVAAVPLQPASIAAAVVSSPANAAVASSVSPPLNQGGDVFRLGSIRRPEELPVLEGCRFFVLWEYTKKPPIFVLKNLESWQLHVRNRCKGPIGPVLLNDSNVELWIPDLPKEYFKLPYVACKSDFVRYAVLYHHGGVYMDTDFLVVKDLDEIIDLIPSHDLISYTTSGQHCKAGSFSSNFMASRKGSVGMKAVWESQKDAVTNHCKLADKAKGLAQKLCCFPKGQCQVPWASLGEGISHRVLGGLLAKQELQLKIKCYDGDESFVPESMLEMLTMQPHPTKARADNLWIQRNVRQPFDRIMYHLFNSNFNAQTWSGRRLFDPNVLVGYLYVKSGVSPPEDPLTLGPAEQCANDGEHCECTGTVYYGRKFTDSTEKHLTDLAKLTENDHQVKKVEEGIYCSPDEFGGDPLFGTPKHCLCQKGNR